MVLHKVSQGAGGFVKHGPALDADGLGSRDADASDAKFVPHGPEYGVGKAKYQNILSRFFGQVVVDAIDLLLAEIGMQAQNELLRRFEVVAEGFFDHDAAVGGTVLAAGGQ